MVILQYSGLYVKEGRFKSSSTLIHPDIISIPMPLTFHPLRQRLREKHVVTGVFCELPCPEAVEIIGIAGWDFTVIDCEHAPITAALLPHMVRAAAAARLPAIVRVASNDPAGHPARARRRSIRGADSANRFSRSRARRRNGFAILSAGRERLQSVRSGGRFFRAATPEFLARANDDVSLILQIESAAGIEAVDGILAIEGIDALFVGPYDLSQSLGIPGETSHPRVFAAAERIVRSAEANGVAVGVFTNSEQDALRWLSAGVRYLCLSVDTVFLLNAMRVGLTTLRRNFDFH